MKVLILLLLLFSVFVMNDCKPVNGKETDDEDTVEQTSGQVQETLKDDRKLIFVNPDSHHNMIEESTIISQESAEKRAKSTKGIPIKTVPIKVIKGKGKKSKGGQKRQHCCHHGCCCDCCHGNHHGGHHGNHHGQHEHGYEFYEEWSETKGHCCKGHGHHGGCCGGHHAHDHGHDCYGCHHGGHCHGHFG